MTAKIVITNGTLTAFIPFRKSQIVINTWHGGGAYKSSGIYGVHNEEYIYSKFVLKKAADDITCFITSSRVFSENMSRFYFIGANKFLPIGMPRNDIFFSPQEMLCQEVKKRIDINHEYGIVLYAPTFRGHISHAAVPATIDTAKVLNALSSRFDKKFVLLFRMHHSLSGKKIENGLDVSAYADVQELLLITDVLIADYSSVMWDFSLTNKPCFVYAPDILDYKGESGFSTPIEEWPFSVAETNEQLEENIISFSPEIYIEKIKKHHLALGSFETGTARMEISNLIMKYI
jgi:CDP-glycerol glycerophosphotransferase